VFKIQRGCYITKKNSDGCNERTWSSSSSSGRKEAEWLKH